MHPPSLQKCLLAKSEGKGGISLDASFLLTVEVFCFLFVFFTYSGENVSRKDQTQFLVAGNRKQKRPNPISGGREP